MSSSHRPIRPQRPAAAALLGPRLLLGLLGVLALLAFGTAFAGAAPERIADVELAAVHGGTCTSQCDGGSSDDADDDASSPTRTGASYWVESRRTLNSQDSSREVLEDMIINRSSSPLDTEFSYRHRTVRKIEFGGGWGSAFSAKVGGEIDVTRTRTLRKTLRPYEVGKVYTRLLTSRYTVYGTRYQDYSDGSREQVGSASGPYVTGRTVTGYVTYFLN